MSGKEIKEELLHLQQKADFVEVVASIKTGRFKRNTQQTSYQHRLIYTKYLRAYVYDPARLNIVFSDAALQHLFFRTFGYQGNTRFTIYPNVWLRDLPLLDIGENVYLGDGILLGTNQVSENQQFIKVGKISIGNNSIFDQQCSVGLDTKIGHHVQARFRAAVGLKCTLGNHVVLGECCVIGHKTQLDDGVIIGTGVKLGNFVKVEANVHIPEHAVIPSFSHVTQQGVFSNKPTPHKSSPNALLSNTLN